MRKLLLLAVAALSAAASFAKVPERVIVLSGDSAQARQEVMDLLYDTREFQFHDASAPRFLLLDRQGRIALGIGGQIYGTASYDFGGTCPDGADFIPFDIATGNGSLSRDALNFTANHSSLFLQLAGHNDKIGPYMAYVQAAFTGGGSAYNFKLKQAYFRIGDFTAGLALSTFCDPAGLPSVNTQGPNGLCDLKTVLLRYAHSFNPHWRIGVGIEQPKATYTLSSSTQAIAQRVPDVPAWVQYSWGSGSHLRLSGVIRNLSYHDNVAERNRFATAGGVQLSSTINIYGGLSFYGSGSYGTALGTYLQDLSGNDLTLIPSAKAGKLKAPRSWAYVGGLRYDFSRKFFASAGWSQVRLLDQQQMAADTYRRSSYLQVNAFYNLDTECRIGLEYDYGFRRNMDGSHGDANRMMLAAKYSF